MLDIQDQHIPWKKSESRKQEAFKQDFEIKKVLLTAEFTIFL